MESHHDVLCEAGTNHALVIGPQRETDRVQAKIGAAAFVGYWKTISTDPDLAPSDKGKANTARSDDNDAAVSSVMGADTRNRRVMGVNDGAEGMRPQQKLLKRTFAADPGKSDGSMQRTQRVGAKPCFIGRGTTGFFDLGKRPVDPDAQRGRAGNAGPEQASIRVLDARAATSAATVNSDE
jgi:hypothetical protein